MLLSQKNVWKYRFPQREQKLLDQLEHLKADRETIRNLPVDSETKMPEFKITIERTEYTDRKEAAEAFEKAAFKFKTPDTPVKIGSFQGFDLSVVLHSNLLGSGNSVPVTSPCVTGTENLSSCSYTEPVITTAPVTELSTVISTAVTTACTTEATSEVTETAIETEPETTENTVQGVICGEMLQNVDYVEYQLPDNPDYRGFKSYEPYDLITAQSVQLWLQQETVTDANGFHLLDNRYLIAVGTFCNAPCGTYIELILENGTLIPCIVGDIKSDAHTDETHTYTLSTMCASEFIVDDTICPAVWYGDVSMVYEEWNSKIHSVRVYHKNYY